MGRGSGGVGAGRNGPRGGNNPARTLGGQSGLGKGLQFGTDHNSAIRRTLVQADVGKVNRSLALDPEYHVGKGGTGPTASVGKYERAQRFLRDSQGNKTVVRASKVGLDRKGRVYIEDGRHRFAALRDSGAKTVPVAVPRGQAARFARLFGADS